MKTEKFEEITIAEYSTKLNSSGLCQMMTNRRMKKIDYVQEYFLVMRELAGRGKIGVMIP